MKTVKGTTRIIIIFKNFVVKLPIIHFRRAIRSIWVNFRRGYLLECLSWDIYALFSPRRLLFRGILENWREFCYYFRSRSPFLVPTYFSLFGIINFQKRGEKTKNEYENLWHQLYYITNGEIRVDSHTFENSDNFCDEDGNLMIVDYGNIRIHGVLDKYGNKIFKDFYLS